MLIANYYPGDRNSHAALDIARIVDGRRQDRETIEVSGRREARAIATERGAMPWNF